MNIGQFETLLSRGLTHAPYSPFEGPDVYVGTVIVVAIVFFLVLFGFARWRVLPEQTVENYLVKQQPRKKVEEVGSVQKFLDDIVNA